MNVVQQPFDREIVPGMTIDDLDLHLVTTIMQSGIDLGRYKGPLDPVVYLERFSGVVRDGETLRPTVAGVLAFSHEPDRWITASGIDIALYRSDQTLPTRSRVEQARGPIFQVIDQTVALLQEECTVNRLEGARLIAELDTPQIVLRELTTNAVVHRDLRIFGSQVRIQVFPRSIEWSSPGGLPEGITISTLLTAQFSRNPTLAQFLFHGGFIEKFGMGLDAVTNALTRAKLDRPEFHDDVHSFRVRVQRAQLLDDGQFDLTTRDGRSRAILNLFTIQHRWRQHEMIETLSVPRSTLQRDLDLLVERGELVVDGATKSRVYRLPDAPKAERQREK